MTVPQRPAGRPPSGSPPDNLPTGFGGIAPYSKEVAVPLLLHEPSGARVDPKTGRAVSKTGRLITGQSKGYLKIGADYYDNGKRRTKNYLIHRVIWELVHGQVPSGLVINHINGIKHDNRVENLEAVTSKQNNEHAIRTGLAVFGERDPKAKLTSAQVREIRRTDGSVTSSEWARRLGVTAANIHCIRKRKTWKQLAD